VKLNAIGGLVLNEQWKMETHRTTGSFNRQSIGIPPLAAAVERLPSATFESSHED